METCDTTPPHENTRVRQVRLEPDCLVAGVRLKAKQREFQAVTGGEGYHGIGDSYIIKAENTEHGPRYTCRTFVWQNEFILSFEELIGIYSEATVLRDDRPEEQYELGGEG